MSGVVFKTYEDVTETPGNCGRCDQVVTDGLAHKVAGAAGEEFHRLHNECLYQVLKGDRTCPLCHERVTSIDHESVNDSESSDEDGDYLCGLYMHKMESEKIRKLYTDVIDAAKKGESDTLDKLLNSLENPVPYQKKAVRTAAAYGHNDIVRTLLNGCTHFENSNDTLSGMDALISGAWGGNVEIVRETLIRYPSINRDGAVCAAAEKGQTEVLELLLSNATISNAVRQRAIKEALQNRHMRAVLLLSRGYIACGLVVGAAAALTVRAAMDVLASYSTQHSEL